MEIIIKPCKLDKNIYKLSVENYDYEISSGWVKNFIFDGSLHKYKEFLKKTNCLNIVEKFTFDFPSALKFNNIVDAQLAIDILNSITILKALT